MWTERKEENEIVVGEERRTNPVLCLSAVLDFLSPFSSETSPSPTENTRPQVCTNQPFPDLIVPFGGGGGRGRYLQNCQV